MYSAVILAQLQAAGLAAAAPRPLPRRPEKPTFGDLPDFNDADTMHGLDPALKDRYNELRKDHPKALVTIIRNKDTKKIAGIFYEVPGKKGIYEAMLSDRAPGSATLSPNGIELQGGQMLSTPNRGEEDQVQVRISNPSELNFDARGYNDFKNKLHIDSWHGSKDMAYRISERTTGISLIASQIHPNTTRVYMSVATAKKMEQKISLVVNGNEIGMAENPKPKPKAPIGKLEIIVGEGKNARTIQGFDENGTARDLATIAKEVTGAADALEKAGKGRKH